MINLMNSTAAVLVSQSISSAILRALFVLLKYCLHDFFFTSDALDSTAIANKRWKESIKNFKKQMLRIKVLNFIS